MRVQLKRGGLSGEVGTDETTRFTVESLWINSPPCICPCRWLQTDAPWCHRKADTLRGGWRGWLRSPTRPRAYRTALSSPPQGPWSGEFLRGLLQNTKSVCYKYRHMRSHTHTHTRLGLMGLLCSYSFLFLLCLKKKTEALLPPLTPATMLLICTL